MGGMAAFIPSRRDPEVNAGALAKVRDDKEREAGDGFDGSWVAHPDLVPVCPEVFDRVLGDRPNQLDRRRDEVSVTRRPAARHRRHAGRGHRGRAARQHLGGAALPRVLAGRQRRGRHRQPHGGRGHRRDLPVADLAVDPQRHHAGHRRGGHRGPGPADPRRGDGRLGPEFAAGPRALRAGRAGRRFADFLTLPAYELID